MKNRSIRQMMLYMIGTILAIMLFFQILTAYSNNKTITELNETLELQLLYDSYKETIETLQEGVTAYFNHSAKITVQDIEELCTEIESTSLQMEEAFVHPQFTDHSYIVQAYLESIRVFLEQIETTETEEQFQYYNETMGLYRMTLASYETLQPFEKEIITKKIHESSEEWKQKEKIFLVLGAVVCGLGFWKGKKFVDDISMPIIALTAKVRQIIARNYGELQENDLPKTRCKETALLTEAFYEMAGTIRQQIDELQEKIIVSQKLHKLEIENMQTKISLNQTQICLMQSLISPHFLFNCLSTLTSLAFIEEAHQTEECSLQLAKFLRKFLDHIGKTIPIREEVEHTKEYIKIQQLRFGKRISFEIICDRECEGQKIPALILQPLVENSLSHGLKNCRGGGLIQIDIHKIQKEEIAIEVRDNGEGISEEQMKQIEEELKKPFESGQKGIGLRSIAYRLNDFFKNRSSVHLEAQTKGTVAKIIIPADS